MYSHSPLLQCAFASRATSTLPAVLLTAMIRLERTRLECQFACYHQQQRCNNNNAGPLRSRHGLRDRLSQPLRCSSSRTSRILSATSHGEGPGLTSSPASPPPAYGKRYAVIGGGFAGIAVAWHLLASSTAEQPVSVDLYDAAGIGMGGSGAAAGLLHPFSPRGKLLWRGEEAMVDALELVAAAEAAVGATAAQQGGASAVSTVSAGADADTDADAYPGAETFVWRQPLMRAAVSTKQARDLSGVNLQYSHFSAVPITTEQMITLVPGITQSQLQPCIEASEQSEPIPEAVVFEEGPFDKFSPRGLVGSKGGARRKVGRMGPQAKQIVGPQQYSGILIDGGLALHPHRYLEALWESCQQRAALHGGRASLLRLPVRSLEELEAEAGPHAAVIVAAGAAIGTIAEMRDLFPLQLSQGYVLDMVPASSSKPYPDSSPSLLGSTYISAQGRSRLLVGATKRPMLSAEEAFQPSVTRTRYTVYRVSATPAGLVPHKECGRPVETASEIQSAADALRPLGEEKWERLSEWEVDVVRTGVRAIPGKTAQGAIPYAGRIDSVDPARRWWAVTGLGARGLVYHGWLGRLLAEAIGADDESLLPPELMRWKPEIE